MLLQELKEQVSKLPASDRLALVSAIIESLQSLQEDTPISETERSGAIRRMRGLLKTEQPASTDEEVAAMLEERRAENYLQ
jgi:putative addiction module component (TIGR02574 family)